jgi:hypothetical protein
MVYAVSTENVESFSAGVGLGAGAAAFLLLLFTLISFGLRERLKVGIGLSAANNHSCLLFAVRLDLPAGLAVDWVSLEHVENFSARSNLGAGAAAFRLLLFTLLSF